MKRGFQHHSIPFSQRDVGEHDGFVRILKVPPSYREAAQFFEGTRRAVMSWVERKWVPICHWPDLERLSIAYDQPERLSDFVQWGLECGLQPLVRKHRSWTDKEAEICIRALRNFAARMKLYGDDRDEAAAHAFADMLERGVTDLNYGMTTIENYARRKNWFACIGDDLWVFDTLQFSEVTPERAIIAKDRLRIVGQISEALPEYLKEVYLCLQSDMTDSEISDTLGISVKSVSARKSGVRQILARLLDDIEAA